MRPQKNVITKRVHKKCDQHHKINITKMRSQNTIAKCDRKNAITKM